jgi:hypothetical protein
MEHSDHWVMTGWHGEQWYFQNNEKKMEHSHHWISKKALECSDHAKTEVGSISNHFHFLIDFGCNASIHTRDSGWNKRCLSRSYLTLHYYIVRCSQIQILKTCTY